MTAITVVAWCGFHAAFVKGRAAALGYRTLAALEQLPFPTWYGLLETWFVEAHTTLLAPAAQVLQYLVEDLVEQEGHRYAVGGLSSSLAERQRVNAEAMYGAAPAR